MNSLSGHYVKRVEEFKYLGSYIGSTQNDVSVRIRSAWEALNILNSIWKSNLSSKLKINLFRARVETVLVYGSITWTLTSKLNQYVDVVYKRMMRATLNKST